MRPRTDGCGAWAGPYPRPRRERPSHPQPRPGGGGRRSRIIPPFPGEATEYGLFTGQSFGDGHRFTIQVDPQATEMKEGVSIRGYAAPATPGGADLGHAVLLEWELRDAPPGRPQLKTVQRRPPADELVRADGSAQLLGEHETLSGESVLPGLEVALPDVFVGT